MYSNLQKPLSYNALFTFIIGERGVGKTYSATKHVIKRFLKSGEEFVYLRRYKTELKNSVPKFFDALINNANDQEAIDICNNHKLSVKNNTFYCDNKKIGYAIALSTANILKSTSFSKVKWIIFDEFIIDKGCYHYLQNEVTQLLDIVETIARLRDVRVLFLGNAISITNPYFTYFDLSLPYKSECKTFKDGLILVNYIKNIEYREVKKASKFGKLIDGTDYGKYAIDNEFLRDSKAFISKKTSNAKFYFTLYVSGIDYGIWVDYKESMMYISLHNDPNCHIKFSINSEDHNDKTLLLRFRTSPFLKSIIEHYRLGKLAFENQKVKNNIMQVITKYLTY